MEIRNVMECDNHQCCEFDGAEAVHLLVDQSNSDLVSSCECIPKHKDQLKWSNKGQEISQRHK